jgi:UDPglucose 6-dehydrogenase
MSFLYAGLGYGGSCFPKDVHAIIHRARSGLEFPLLNAVDDVNNRQKRRLFEKVREFYNGSLKGRTFGVWGLSFKPRTDDMRDAPSIGLIEDLWPKLQVKAHDPRRWKSPLGVRRPHRLPPPELRGDRGRRRLLVVTSGTSFAGPTSTASNACSRPVVFDSRNLWGRSMRKLGFAYFPIGRPSVQLS